MEEAIITKQGDSIKYFNYLGLDVLKLANTDHIVESEEMLKRLQQKISKFENDWEVSE